MYKLNSLLENLQFLGLIVIRYWVLTLYGPAMHTGEILLREWFKFNFEFTSFFFN